MNLSSMIARIDNIRASIVCATLFLCLISLTCVTAQDFRLQRTWMLEHTGGVTGRLDRTPQKTMAVQKSGNLIVEAHLMGYPYDDGHASGDVFLFDRSTAM